MIDWAEIVTEAQARVSFVRCECGAERPILQQFWSRTVIFFGPCSEICKRRQEKQGAPL